MTEEFFDIFAQTLTYGMFAARLNDKTPASFSRYEAMKLIPDTNPFLKRLFQYVATNLEPELEWVVDDLAEMFKAVAAIGRELIETHLMRDPAPGLSETRARFPVIGDNTVETVAWEDAGGGSGRVRINATQYFDNVPKEAWETPIGGYRPAEKWLKDRRGRPLSSGDLGHYRRIVLALVKTAALSARLGTAFPC